MKQIYVLGITGFIAVVAIIIVFIVTQRSNGTPGGPKPHKPPPKPRPKPNQCNVQVCVESFKMLMNNLSGDGLLDDVVVPTPATSEACAEACRIKGAYTANWNTSGKSPVCGCILKTPTVDQACILSTENTETWVDNLEKANPTRCPTGDWKKCSRGQPSPLLLVSQTPPPQTPALCKLQCSHSEKYIGAAVVSDDPPSCNCVLKWAKPDPGLAEDVPQKPQDSSCLFPLTEGSDFYITSDSCAKDRCGMNGVGAPVEGKPYLDGQDWIYWLDITSCPQYSRRNRL
jgi:hypothetical protein